MISNEEILKAVLLNNNQEEVEEKVEEIPLLTIIYCYVKLVITLIFLYK